MGSIDGAGRYRLSESDMASLGVSPGGVCAVLVDTGALQIWNPADKPTEAMATIDGAGRVRVPPHLLVDAGLSPGADLSMTFSSDHVAEA